MDLKQCAIKLENNILRGNTEIEENIDLLDQVLSSTELAMSYNFRYIYPMVLLDRKNGAWEYLYKKNIPIMDYKITTLEQASSIYINYSCRLKPAEETNKPLLIFFFRLSLTVIRYIILQIHHLSQVLQVIE